MLIDKAHSGRMPRGILLIAVLLIFLASHQLILPINQMLGRVGVLIALDQKHLGDQIRTILWRLCNILIAKL